HLVMSARLTRHTVVGVTYTQERAIRYRGLARYRGSQRAILLAQLAIPLLFTSLPIHHPLNTAIAALVQVNAGSYDRWGADPSSASEEWSLQCERENKQASGPLVSFPAICAPGRPREQQFQSATAQVLVPIVFSPPRKLSPRSAEDDAFWA